MGKICCARVSSIEERDAANARGGGATVNLDLGERRTVHRHYNSNETGGLRDEGGRV